MDSLGSTYTKRCAVYETYSGTFSQKNRLSGNLVGISINLCKSIQKELFINDTP